MDCSQFPLGFSRLRYTSIELPPSWIVKASVTWGECLNYRGGPLSGYVDPPHSRSSRYLDALSRLRSALQSKMAAVRSKPTSLENYSKIGDYDQSSVLKASCIILIELRMASSFILSSFVPSRIQAELQVLPADMTGE